MSDGSESRNQDWAYERAEYEVSQAAKLPEEYQPLMAFFRLMAGRANSFRFRDWTDYICAVGAGTFITSDGSPTGKQMVKAYTFGGYTFYRKITKPVVGKITTDAVALEYTTGVASSGTYWSGEFDLHCRFNTDVMRHETVNRNPSKGLIVTWQSIPIVEVRDE